MVEHVYVTFGDHRLLAASVFEISCG